MKSFFEPKRTGLLFFLFAVAFGLIAAPLSAQQAGAGDAAPEMRAEQKGELLYLEFKSASLINVLGVLSEITKINFVAGSEVANRPVNMTLDGVTLDQTLQAISNGSNVTYANIPDSNIIMFRASSDAVQLAPLYTRVFKLYFLRASKIQEIDAGQSSSGGSSGTSGLSTLTSSENNSNQISSTSSQDVSVIKVIEKMLSERGSVAVDDRSNSLIVTDTEDRLSRVAAVIAELDRPLNQVLINVLLVETFEDLDRQLGVEWARGTGAADGLFGTWTGGISDTRFPFNLESVNREIFQPNPPLSGLTPSGSDTLGTKDFSSLNIRVKALQSASKLRIIAKPNILVMDNHPAIIKVATNAAIGQQTVTAASTDSATSTASTSAERAEVGTILRVTPQINSQDQITMTIEPTFATVDTSTITIGAAQTGDTTVRAARTTVMVNSGKTLVMGGLLFSEQSDGDRKVPFFGDIPVLGKMFTKEDKAIQDRELILFLTPQIVKNPSAMTPSVMPDRYERFDDVNADFWKYKKKTWYKEMAEGKKSPTDFDSYFKVRENAMDKTAFELQDQKETAMKQEVQSVGKTQSASDGVRWDVR